MSKIAIYPGTFDPITFGHIDVIKKSLKLFDKIVVGVSEESNKNYLFSTNERIDIVNKALFKDLNLNEDDFVIPRDKGDIVCFPSFLMHKVYPLTSGTRHSIVSWLSGDSWK